MNLLISLPAGILIIIAIFTLLTRRFKNSTYMLAGIISLLVIMVYGMVAAISWPGADVFAIHIALYLLTVYGMTIIASQKRKKSKLHWAPVTLFVFFGVILITDSVLILLAQSGMNNEWVKLILPEPTGSAKVRSVFPGTVSHDFREKSEQFNIYQQQRQHQMELGWSIKLGWKDDALTGVKNTLYVEIKNADNRLLRDAEVTAKFMYPADMKLDQKHQLTMNEQGIYQAELTLMNPGDWDMILNVKHNQDTYEMRTKTTIKQGQ
jgi:nitrogen fixation protein FixH